MRLAPALRSRPRARSTPRCSFDNAAGELRPGMYGRGVDRRRDCTRARRSCPSSAVQISTSKRYVFVARTATRSSAASVTIGVDDGDWLEVTQGPRGGRRGRHGRHRRRLATARTVRVVARRRPVHGAKAPRRRAAASPAPSAHGAADEGGTMWLTRLALRNPDPHPDDVADGASCSARVSLQPPQRRSLPRHHHPGHPRRDLLHGRRARGHREDDHPAHRARGRVVARASTASRARRSRASRSSASGSTTATNLDNAQFEVPQRVAQILNTLPPGIQQPFIIKFDITNIPVVQVVDLAATGSTRSSSTISPTTSSSRSSSASPASPAPRVGGGKMREIEVKVNRDALRARGLGILDVVNAVRGVEPAAAERQPARRRPRLQRLHQHAGRQAARRSSDVVVRAGHGRRARAQSDAAGARRATSPRSRTAPPTRAKIVRINGQRGVYLRVLKQPGRQHHRAWSTPCARRCPNLRGVPPNVKLDDLVRSVDVHPRRGAARSSTRRCRAACSPVAVILVFLVSLRATGHRRASPSRSRSSRRSSLLYFTGQTLNVFTLGGLALGVGRLVDDSIVELENIHRHLALGPRPRSKAVLAAAQEVAMPILVSTITTIVVFFPVLFLTGVARNLFLPLALTIAFALVMSFFVSRTVTPLLCLYWLKGRRTTRPRHRAARITRGARPARRRLRARRSACVLAPPRSSPSSAILGALRRVAASCCKLHRHRVLPRHRRGAVQRHLQDADRHARRADRAGRRAHRGGRRRRRSRRCRRRQTSALHDDALRQRPARAAARRSSRANTGPHAGNVQVNLVAEGRSGPSRDVQATETVRARAARRAARHAGLLLHRRHREAHPQLRRRRARSTSRSSATTSTTAPRYAKQHRRQAARRSRDADGQAAAHRRPDLARGELPRARRRRRSRRRPACSASASSRSRRRVLASLVGNTQFAPIPFTDPKTGNEYFINVRLDDRVPQPRRPISTTCSCARRRAAIVPLDTRRARSSARAARCMIDAQVPAAHHRRDGQRRARQGPRRGERGRAAACSTSMPPPEGFTRAARRPDGRRRSRRSRASGFAALMALALVYMVLASQFKSLLDPLVIMFSVPLGISRRVR